MSFLKFLHLDNPDSLKRSIAAFLGAVAVLAVNPVLAAKGLPPVSDATLEAFAALIVAFLLQSGANAAAAKLSAAKAAGELAGSKVEPGAGADKILADIAGAASGDGK